MCRKKPYKALLQGETGKELTLGELGNLAARLTAHLRQQGFLVAFAHLLPQQVEDGIVAFGIIPGRYDRIAIRGNAQVNDAFLRSLFHAVREGEIIRRDLTTYRDIKHRANITVD